jgi:methionyl-tRNA formyltransferase
VNVLLVAEESAGVRVLRALLEAGHRVPAVLTSAPGAGFRGATVRDVAAAHGLAVHPAARVRDADLADLVRAESVDLLLNVHSLHLVHRAVLAAPRIGAFNLHPGPLPECAGLNAPSWAIYHREPRHGVTVHWMVAGVDRGPIAYQERFAIRPEETALSLGATCIRVGLELLRRLLDAAARGPAAIPAEPQDTRRWRYFGRDVPQEGWIDWSRPAADVLAFVRACDFGPLPSPWGAPRALVGGVAVEVRRARATGRPTSGAAPGTVEGAGADGGLAVAAADEWVGLDEVWRDGRRLSASALAAGRAT